MQRRNAAEAAANKANAERTEVADQHSSISSSLRKYDTSQRQSGSVTITVEYEKDTLVDRVETLVDRVEMHKDSSLGLADVEWAADEHSYGY